MKFHLLKKMKALNYFFPIFFGILFFFIMMVIIHELGHYFVHTALINNYLHLIIWPGYEVLPNFGIKSISPLPDAVIAATYELIPDTASILGSDLSLILKHRSYSLLMGSGSTLLLSLFSLLTLSIVKPRKLFFWFFAMCSLLHLDMLTYTVFPIFFGLKHMIFVGGSQPEPIIALTQLGFSKFISIPGVITLSLIQFFWLYRIIGFQLKKPLLRRCLRLT